MTASFRIGNPPQVEVRPEDVSTYIHTYKHPVHTEWNIFLFLIKYDYCKCNNSLSVCLSSTTTTVGSYIHLPYLMYSAPMHTYTMKKTTTTIYIHTSIYMTVHYKDTKESGALATRRRCLSPCPCPSPCSAESSSRLPPATWPAA